MHFKQITIIGTGLIGGSLAMAVKQHKLVGKIIGCDREPVLKKTVNLRAIDVGEPSPEKAVAGSDVVVLATPVGAIIELMERLGPLLPPSTLLTDVGSTKLEIVRRAKMVFGGAADTRFLAGHPIAGKEHGGIEQAEATLFDGAVWIFTSSASSQAGPKKAFTRLVEGIGAKVMFMDPERHDRLCAWISHLPQLLSTAVAGSLIEEFGDAAELNRIGGRALRELTRTASSPYYVWRDIAHTNATNIEEALLKLEQRLAHIRENLKTPELRAEFERANRFRKD